MQPWALTAEGDGTDGHHNQDYTGLWTPRLQCLYRMHIQYIVGIPVTIYMHLKTLTQWQFTHSSHSNPCIATGTVTCTNVVVEVIALAALVTLVDTASRNPHANNAVHFGHEVCLARNLYHRLVLRASMDWWLKRLQFHLPLPTPSIKVHNATYSCHEGLLGQGLGLRLGLGLGLHLRLGLGLPLDLGLGLVISCLLVITICCDE
jgi:hypothetical protein